jgi:hypothetical protein
LFFVWKYAEFKIQLGLSKGGKMTASKKAGVLYNLAKQAKRRMKNYNNGGIQRLSYAKNNG